MNKAIHTKESIASEMCQKVIAAVEALRQHIVSIAEQAKPKVLIVDDVETDAELLRQQIYRQCVPMEVTVAASCEEALAKLQSIHFDLVFLDLRFPHMTGVDLLQAVNAVDSDTTFIAMSGLDDSAQPMKDALRLGALAVFQKPFSEIQMKKICGLMNG